MVMALTSVTWPSMSTKKWTRHILLRLEDRRAWACSGLYTRLLACRWRRKSEPFWRAKRGHVCGYAMDFGGAFRNRTQLRPASETHLGCTRQLDELPCGNRTIYRSAVA